MILVVTDRWSENYLDELCELISKIDQSAVFSDSKIKIEKQRQEWPEAWRLIDSIVSARMLENKFLGE